MGFIEKFPFVTNIRHQHVTGKTAEPALPKINYFNMSRMIKKIQYLKRSMNAIPFENDDYIGEMQFDNIQDNYNQGSTHSYLQDLIDINSMGKSPSEKAKLQTLGNAYETLMADNKEILWNSFFGL